MRFSFIPFLLLVVPIIEIGTFIAIGDQIGIAATLLMILVTAIIGTMLLRHQGLSLIKKIQDEMNEGKVPGRALGDAAMILVAGILLLTPGFVTDTLGFLLFVPPVRAAIWGFIASRITVVRPGGTGSPFSQDQPFGQNRPNPDMQGDGPVIDLDEDDYSSGPPNSDSPWNNKS